MHKEKSFKKPMSPLSFPLTLNVINLRRGKENPETSGNTQTWKRTKWVIYSFFFDDVLVLISHLLLITFLGQKRISPRWEGVELVIPTSLFTVNLHIIIYYTA